MKQHDFELRLLKLWMTTRVPLTRANLLAYSKVERRHIDAWLDAMVRDGIVEVDSDDDGELLWIVRGSSRPAKGLTHLGDVERLEEISRDISKEIQVRPKTSTGVSRRSETKSALASGILSFVFGPLGWLYAAPLKEAIPAALAMMALSALLPKFLLLYIFGLLNPLSGIAGLLYAWSYNKTGRRMPLFGKEERPLLERPRR